MRAFVLAEKRRFRSWMWHAQVRCSWRHDYCCYFFLRITHQYLGRCGRRPALKNEEIKHHFTRPLPKTEGRDLAAADTHVSLMKHSHDICYFLVVGYLMSICCATQNGSLIKSGLELVLVDATFGPAYHDNSSICRNVGQLFLIGPDEGHCFSLSPIISIIERFSDIAGFTALSFVRFQINTKTGWWPHGLGKYSNLI